MSADHYMSPSRHGIHASRLNAIRTNTKPLPSNYLRIDCQQLYRKVSTLANTDLGILDNLKNILLFGSRFNNSFGEAATNCTPSANITATLMNHTCYPIV